MGDDLKEPRKHTKMYHDVVMRLIGGDTRTKQLLGEINALMGKYETSPVEFQRAVRFVCERHRWQSYAIRQGAEQPKPKPKPMQWFDDDDIEGEEHV
jgi:Mg-chelatase subunit ChlI